MKPKYIDVHSHVNFAAYDEDRDIVIKRTLESGVWMLNVGTQKDTSQSVVELCEKYDEGVYGIVGLHPIHTSASYHDTQELGEGGREFTSRGEDFDRDFYKKLTEHPKVVGIGECGLDYYRVEKETREKQFEVFRKHIELSLEVNLPLMLHVRPTPKTTDAYEDALSILSEFGDKPRGNVHFFVGTTDIADRFFERGFTVSFTGVITFADSYDKVVRNAPLDMILSETDAPFIAPALHRGKRNEPLHVRDVVRRIAELKREDEEKVREALIENARKVFSLPI